MQQIEVNIMGRSYLLSCPDDGEAQLREAVARVDTAMCKIRDAGKIKARDRIAVLAALNLAFEGVLAPVARATPDTSSKEAVTAPAESAEQQAALATILARLDQALRTDGQLV